MSKNKNPRNGTTDARAALKVQDIARELGISEEHVAGLIESGEITGINVGTASRNYWRVPAEAFDEYKARSSSLSAKAGRPTGGKKP